MVEASVDEGEAKASTASLHLHGRLLHLLPWDAECAEYDLRCDALVTKNCSEIRSGHFMDCQTTVGMLRADLHDSDAGRE